MAGRQDSEGLPELHERDAGTSGGVCRYRERETGTGRLGKVTDTGNVLEEDDKANCFLQ